MWCKNICVLEFFNSSSIQRHQMISKPCTNGFSPSSHPSSSVSCCLHFSPSQSPWWEQQHSWWESSASLCRAVGMNFGMKDVTQLPRPRPLEKKQGEILEQKQRSTHHLWDSVAEHIYENRDNCRFVAIHPHTITEDNDPNPQVLNSLLNSHHGKILLKLFSPPMLLVHVLVRLKWSSVACCFTAVHPVMQLTPCLLLRYSWHALGSIRTEPSLSGEDGKCLLHKTE